MKDIERLEWLQKSVIDAIIELERQNKKSEYYNSAVSQLLKMNADIINYLKLIKGGRHISVGVFGRPSRGKSTLLNVLLGVDILPMKSWPGTTRFGTILSYKKSESTEPYEVTVEFKDSSQYYEPRSFENVEDVKSELEYLAKEANYENPNIHMIKVEGPFRSYICDDIDFVDTPGIELGASKEELDKDDVKIDHDYDADAERALAVLDNVDMVIFCMRFDYQERKDKKIYDDHIRKYHPINVITHSDKRDEGMTNDKIRNKSWGYNLLIGDTVVVSSKEALKIINAPENKDKDIKKEVEAEFTGEYLEEFSKLKKMIRKKAGNRNSADIKVRINRFEERYNNIKKEAANKKIILPELGAWKIKEAIEKREKAKRIAKEAIKKIVIIILIACLIAVLVGVAAYLYSRKDVLRNVTIVPQENLINDVQYEKNMNTMVMPRGAEVTLTAVKKPRNAVTWNIVWTVDNNNVVTLTSTVTQAVITALAVGTTRVTVTIDEKHTNYIDITVIRAPDDDIPVESVTFNPPNNLIVGGATYILNGIIIPSNASVKTVTWESSDTSVAEVDMYTGVVTPLNAGTANITVTADGRDENDNPVAFTAPITVKDVKLTLFNQGISAAGTTLTLPERNPATNRFTISNTNPNARFLTGQDGNESGKITGATIVYLVQPLSNNSSISARVRIVERRTNSNENGVVVGMISNPAGDISFWGMLASVTGQKRAFFSETDVNPANTSQKLAARGGSGWLDDANDIVSINGVVIPYDEEFILEVRRITAQSFITNLRDNNTGEIIATGSNTINLQNPVPGFIIANATVEIGQIIIKDGNDIIFSTIESDPIRIVPATIEFSFPSLITGTYPAFKYEHSIAEGNNTRTFGARVLPARALQNIIWTIDGANASLSSAVGSSVTATFTQTGTVTITAKVADVPNISATLTINVSNTVIPVNRISVRADNGASGITAGGAPLRFFADITPANATNQAYTLTIGDSNDYAASRVSIAGARINSAGYLNVDQSYRSPSIWVFAASAADPNIRSSLEINVESYYVPNESEEDKGEEDEDEETAKN